MAASRHDVQLRWRDDTATATRRSHCSHHPLEGLVPAPRAWVVTRLSRWAAARAATAAGCRLEWRAASSRTTGHRRRQRRRRPTPPPNTNPAACATPDPFVILGGGTCCNGGWLPPGMVCSSAPPASTIPPPAPPTLIGWRVQPAVTRLSSSGEAHVAAGGWLPPGMVCKAN